VSPVAAHDPRGAHDSRDPRDRRDPRDEVAETAHRKQVAAIGGERG
jgi:hypothetical protein